VRKLSLSLSLSESAIITPIEQFVDILVSLYKYSTTTTTTLSNDTIPKTRSKMKRIKKPRSLTTANKLSSNARKPSANYETTLHPPISISSVSAEPKLVVRCEKQNVSLGKTLFPKLTPYRCIWNMLHKIKETIFLNHLKYLKG